MYLKKILLTVVLLGLVGMAGFSYYVYQNIFTPNTGFNNPQAHVFIPTGATFKMVQEELSPLIKDMNTFVTVAQRKGYSSNIKAGHFIIKKGSNNNEIINSIRSGNIPVTIKFNNQERLENLAGHLAKQIELDSASLLNAMLDEDFLKASGFTQDTALGMYIANSYEVYWNTSPKAFCQKMLKEYNAFWNTSRVAKAKAISLSKDQVMALAAIVQKETAMIQERPTVAGLYLNRLKKGMLLQADPTVIFAKKKTENNFKQVIKRVLFKDLKIASPYNTYRYSGVPPGPITMPDVSAIDGVLNYKKHGFYFMVADVENFGYHKFAKTLSAHNRNKKQYVNWINKQGVKR
ncbi:endolytic transglycosylase MltG [Flavobacteriaceae bacterium]|nr:endolytic transglycosylase MltG [Flavobacteriaceae bacterium]